MAQHGIKSLTSRWVYEYTSTNYDETSGYTAWVSAYDKGAGTATVTAHEIRSTNLSGASSGDNTIITDYQCDATGLLLKLTDTDGTYVTNGSGTAGATDQLVTYSPPELQVINSPALGDMWVPPRTTP